jgi:hypothetical protein
MSEANPNSRLEAFCDGVFAMYKSETAIPIIRQNRQYSYFAFTLYSLCAVAAFWFPVSVALVTTITWIFWLYFGLKVARV